MKIDKETLQRVAHLARLEIKPEDEATMINDMTAILDWVEKLNELDTDNVEPLTMMSYETNVLREDEEKPHLPREEGLLNAPKQDGVYFKVPKVLE